MALRKRQQRPPRRQNRQRSRLRIRQLDRAVTLQPRRVAVPADPPSRLMSLQQSAILRVDITIANATGSITPGGRSKASMWNVSGTGKAAVTCSDIHSLIKAYGPYAHGVTFEFSVRKVAYWGPIPSPTTDESSPILVVDLGGSTAGIAVSDRQAPNHRARIGVTIPYYMWQSSSTDYIIGITPFASTGKAILDISVVWRICDTSSP